MKSTHACCALLLLSLFALCGSVVSHLTTSDSPAEVFVSYERLQPNADRLLPYAGGRPGARDFHLGYQRPGTQLARSLVVRRANDTAVVDIYTPGAIAYVEARDQTNGTGGYVRYYRGGVREDFVQLHFGAVVGAVSDIHFVVEVWTYPSVLVAAADFRRGDLHERSVLDLVSEFVYPAREGDLIVTGMTVLGNDEIKYTYIETFDLSADGSGGYVMMPAGDFGNSSTVRIQFRGVQANMPMNISVALYSEPRANAGRPFRLGEFGAGMQLLNYVYLQVDAVEGEAVSGTVEIEMPGSTIEFVQAKDRVPNGTGELVQISAGGLGSNHMTLQMRSGVGERLEFRFDVYGFENN